MKSSLNLFLEYAVTPLLFICVKERHVYETGICRRPVLRGDLRDALTAFRLNVNIADDAFVA
jgi:hypothetical protein